MSILVSHKTSLFRTKESPLTISYPLEKSTVPGRTKVDNLVITGGQSTKTSIGFIDPRLFGLHRTTHFLNYKLSISVLFFV